MKIAKIFLVIAILAGAAAYARAGEGAGTPVAPGRDMELRFSTMPIQVMVGNLRAEKNMREKLRIAGYLAIKKPTTKAEINELFDFITETDKEDDGGDSLSRYAVNALSRVTDKSFTQEFAKRIKKGSLNERRAAIMMMGQFKNTDAVPDLMDILKENIDETAKTKSGFDKA